MNDAIPQHGRFVWYELATPDKEASQRFYTALFDWQWHVQDMGELGPYPMAHTGESWHCGLITPQEGQPPSWSMYVSVPDVDHACAQAGELGGRVLAPGMDIPNVGRTAVLADPSGAVIMPFTGAHDPAPETPEPAPVGFFCWNELLTSDPAACEAFYTAIFGWQVESNEMNEFGKYWVYRRGSRMECGMMPLPPSAAEGGAPPHWLPYVATDDVAATTARAAELGGTVYCQPTDIPQMGRFAVCADPAGAVFAIFQNA
jgi:predicted enzyme related to lactoylglutathione lyase